MDTEKFKDMVRARIAWEKTHPTPNSAVHVDEYEHLLKVVGDFEACEDVVNRPEWTAYLNGVRLAMHEAFTADCLSEGRILGYENLQQTALSLLALARPLLK
jgi:hypothetical protein